jgi:hypothetical protein
MWRSSIGKKRSIGSIAGLDDDVEDQAAATGRQIDLVAVLQHAAAFDDYVSVRLERADHFSAGWHRFAVEHPAPGLRHDALDQGQVMAASPHQCAPHSGNRRQRRLSPSSANGAITDRTSCGATGSLSVNCSLASNTDRADISIIEPRTASTDAATRAADAAVQIVSANPGLRQCLHLRPLPSPPTKTGSPCLSRNPVRRLRCLERGTCTRNAV